MVTIRYPWSTVNNGIIMGYTIYQRVFQGYVIAVIVRVQYFIPFPNFLSTPFETIVFLSGISTFHWGHIEWWCFALRGRDFSVSHGSSGPTAGRGGWTSLQLLLPGAGPVVVPRGVVFGATVVRQGGALYIGIAFSWGELITPISRSGLWLIWIYSICS